MRFNGIGSFAAHEGLGPTVEGSKLVYVVTAPNDFCSYAIHYREIEFMLGDGDPVVGYVRTEMLKRSDSDRRCFHFDPLSLANISLLSVRFLRRRFSKCE